MTIYILGGGPAGLALAHGLLGSDMSFVVLERGPSLGGLAQTLKWGSHGLHDLGPHKIFTLDADLMARVRALLPQSDWLVRPKKSSIYMKGYFLPYPPSPFSLVKIFGPLKFALMIVDYAVARASNLMSQSKPETFEEDLKGRVGKGLYEALFKPISLKLWGDPTRLDIKLSQGRVQTPSLLEVVGQLLRLRRSSNFEALEFVYPKGGLQKIWDAIQQATARQGKYQLNSEVTGINIKDNRVVAIHFKDREGGDSGSFDISAEDYIFSSLPLSNLVSLMGGDVKAGLADRVTEVTQLNDLLLVFLKIDKPSLLDESWVFVPDADISFHRVSEQESFDPDMTPNGSVVCCEIMNNEIRKMGLLSDAELVETVIKGLQDMGYIGFKVLDQKVIRLKRSYPVFRPGFEAGLREVLHELDALQNFRTIGRQGAFNYIGTLDAMDIGYGAARWLTQELPKGDQSWSAERTRTSHYPVLD